MDSSFLKLFTSGCFFYYINEIRTMSKIIDLCGLTFSANPQAIKQNNKKTDTSKKSTEIDQIRFFILQIVN